MSAEHTARVLVDTHALLWWQAESKRLSAGARSALTSAREVLVSPISCWETSMLVVKGRVRLDRPTPVWVRDLFSQESVAAAELTPDIAASAAELPAFHGDPADRLIYATARSLQVALISKDADLRRYAARHRDCTIVW